VQPQQPAGSNPLGNPVSTEPEHRELPPAHNAPLASRDPLQAG
jgi:hypothetical protein